MAPKDKLSRASWALLESIKDSAQSVTATAFHDNRFKLNQSQATALQELMLRAMEAGYHRAYGAYMKEVDAAFAEFRELEIASKKKK